MSDIVQFLEKRQARQREEAMKELVDDYRLVQDTTAAMVDLIDDFNGMLERRATPGRAAILQAASVLAHLLGAECNRLREELKVVD